MPNQKLILTKDVDEIGFSGDVVNVKPGFARNYLIPRRLAIVATPGALKVWEKGEAKRKAHAEKVLKEARAASESVDGKVFTFKRQAADAEGKIFGSVGKTDILKELREAGIKVPARSILLHQAIKTAGESDVEVRVRNGVSAKVKIKVVAEGTPEHGTVQEAAIPDAGAARGSGDPDFDTRNADSEAAHKKELRARKKKPPAAAKARAKSETKTEGDAKAETKGETSKD